MFEYFYGPGHGYGGDIDQPGNLIPNRQPKKATIIIPIPKAALCMQITAL